MLNMFDTQVLIVYVIIVSMIVFVSLYVIICLLDWITQALLSIVL